MKCGLLYLSQESCLVGDVSYHSYEGLVVQDAERASIAKDLGVHNKVMMLRNHGAVCCGETIEEAFFYAYHLVLACDAQLKMVPLGIDNLVQIEEETRQKVFAMGQRGGGGVDSKTEGGPDGSGDKKKKFWAVGELDFEALMRMLDNAVSSVSPFFRKKNCWHWHLSGISYRLCLQTAACQRRTSQTKGRSWASTCSFVVGLFARGREPVQGRVRNDATSSFAKKKKKPVDFDGELKTGDVRYDNMTKITIKVQLFWRLPYEL